MLWLNIEKVNVDGKSSESPFRGLRVPFSARLLLNRKGGRRRYDEISIDLLKPDNLQYSSLTDISTLPETAKKSELYFTSRKS